MNEDKAGIVWIGRLWNNNGSWDDKHEKVIEHDEAHRP